MENKKEHPEDCRCSSCAEECPRCGITHCPGMCGGGHSCWGGRHQLLRWVLGIVILIIVFWLGFRLGEFKALYLGSDYYGFPMRSMMGGYGGYGGGYDNGWGYYPRGYGMMDGYGGYGMMGRGGQGAGSAQPLVTQ